MLHALLEFALFLWDAHLCLNSEESELQSTASGCEGTRTLSTLFLALRLHLLTFRVSVPNVLLTQNSSSEIVRFSCFPLL